MSVATCIEKNTNKFVNICRIIYLYGLFLKLFSSYVSKKKIKFFEGTLIGQGFSCVLSFTEWEKNKWWNFKRWFNFEGTSTGQSFSRSFSLSEFKTIYKSLWMVYFFGAVLKSQIKEKFVFFLNYDTYKYWHLPIWSLHK